MDPWRRNLSRFHITLLFSLLLAAAPALADKWPPFADELKIERPQVDADAEALLWQIHVLDELNPPSVHSDVSHYLRIKIFTDRGKEIAGRVDIPYEGKTKLVDLAARTIRPDGSTVEVPRNAFFERTVVKAWGRKVKAVSFAFSSVEKGAIVEYRWTERRYEEVAHGVRLVLQRNIPVRTTELFVRPIREEGIQFRMLTFNMETPHFEPAPDDFQRAVIASVRAAREEPLMPAESVVEPWVIFFYGFPTDPTPEHFWTEFSRAAANEADRLSRPDASVKQKAVELAGNAATNDEKLDHLYDFCRSKIQNPDEDAIGGVKSEMEDSKPNHSAAETLKRGAGNGADIDYLFAAMARSLGFETRIAKTADRRDFLFDPRFQVPGLLNEWCVAVRSGDAWRYFDPAARYVPSGMIPWWE